MSTGRFLQVKSCILVAQILLNLILALTLWCEIGFFLVPGDWTSGVLLEGLLLPSIGLVVAAASGALYLRRRDISFSWNSLRQAPPITVWMASSIGFSLILLLIWFQISSQAR